MKSPLIEEVRTFTSILAKTVLPENSRNWLRASKQRRRRAGHRKAGGVIATRDSLVADLRALGVTQGRDLFVHSAMSALGPIEGGATTLFEALAEVAGPAATILVPAYPMSSSMHDWMKCNEIFDLKHTRSQMGGFTEHVRLQTGARRSAHPTHSVAAVGAAAEDYVCDHHKGATATGPLSPFSKHVARRGQLLCLGSSVGKITAYHVIEDIMADFPVAPYLARPMRKTVVLEDGRRLEVETLVHDPRLSPWRIDNFKPKETEFRDLFRARGLMMEGKVGVAPSCVIDAAELIVSLEQWARMGTTIYHRPSFTGFSRLFGTPLHAPATRISRRPSLP